MFTIRFDMRAPEGGTPRAALYSAAIEMCTWAESHRCLAAVLSEHHTVDDGYLPSPLILASAIAARTKTLAITLAAAILPFYDPVRLAEDMNVLDIISEGRVAYVFGLGYRPEEYEHLGVDMAERARIADEKLGLLLSLMRGETVERGGRRIRVTPPPYTAGGPTIMWGGGTPAAARRAGSHGLGFLAQARTPGLQEAYESASRANGHEPGFTMLPDRDTPSAEFVAEDVERAWEELGPHLLHDARSYSSWNPGNVSSAGVAHAQTIEELKTDSTTYRVLTKDEAAERLRGGGVLTLHPLCGGLPPQSAWPYLERAVEVVEGITPQATPPAGPVDT